MTSELTNRCPSCQQPLPEPHKPMRICYDCQKPIERHHKYRFKNIETTGKDMTRLDATVFVHRHCDNPFNIVKLRSEYRDNDAKP